MKLNKNIVGIYKIENITNGKVYIGSSKNIENRWKQHKTLLRSGKHHSQHLQYSWNKYGEDSFSFEVIEDDISQEELLIKEQYWMDKLQAYNPQKGYNISIVAGACVMNDNYNFEEIVDEEYELEHKYKIIYLIMNLLDSEIVYQKFNISRNDCTFNDFIFTMYKYLKEINFNTWAEITLYTSDYQINLGNLYELPDDVCKKIIYNHDYKKIKIEDGRYDYDASIYKDHFKWFKTEIDDRDNLDIQISDGFDLIETAIVIK